MVTGRSEAPPSPLLQPFIESGAVRSETVDVTDPFGVMALFSHYKPSAVLDVTGHSPKALAPAADVRFRTTAQLNTLEAAKLAGTRRVVLMSSMDVYWGLPTSHAPYDEDMPVPIFEHDDHFIVQSWVKKTLEVIANLYRRQAGMDIVLARGAGIYGPLYRTRMNVPSRLAHAAAGRLDLAASALPPADDGYDQLYVKDMARGLSLLLLADRLQHAAYNLGSGQAGLWKVREGRDGGEAWTDAGAPVPRCTGDGLSARPDGWPLDGHKPRPGRAGFCTALHARSGNGRLYRMAGRPSALDKRVRCVRLSSHSRLRRLRTSSANHSDRRAP